MLHFYCDLITERDFAVNSLELVSAPYEHSNIYTLNYVPNLLGPITQRKIIAASSTSDVELVLKKIPLLTGSISSSFKKNNIIAFSRGMLPFSKHIKLYYFYSPYWESEGYQDYYLTLSWPWKLILNWHQKRVLHSLRKNATRVLCANRGLAQKYGLDQSNIVYPFFKSEDYPHVDLVVEKKSITLMLLGASLKDLEQLAQWVNSYQANWTDWNFFIFGQEQHQQYFNTNEKIRFESQYCSATLQAAFLQSIFCFQFNHQDQFAIALGCLASGSYVAHLNSPMLSEIIPEGLRITSNDLTEFINMATEWSFRKIIQKTDLLEARRFALRFSEKSFKDKILKFIAQI